MQVRPSAVIVSRTTPGLEDPAERTSSTRRHVVVSPWADLPKELQGGFKTTKDDEYCTKAPYDPSAPQLRLSELKQRWLDELRRRKAIEDEKMFAAWRAASRLQDELLEKRFTPVETVRAFDHRGTTVRSVSAPLEMFHKKLEKISEREQVRRERVPVVPQPTPSPTPELTEAFADTAFYYPADKQRLKFKFLEEARLAASRMELTNEGWAPTVTPGGAPKKLPNAEHARVSPEEAAWLEEQWNLFLEAEKAKEAAAEAHELALDEAAAIPKAIERTLLNAAELVASPTAAMPGVLLAPTASCKPLEVFRAELPASRLPPRLDLPRTNFSAPAPPWGRQVEEEERWKKRAQLALEALQREEEALIHGGAKVAAIGTGGSRRSILRPLGKGDVDRELKVIRDGGLLKRPAQSVAKKLSSEAVAFVKSLPKDFGKSAGPKSMRPVAMPGAASLKL